MMVKFYVATSFTQQLLMSHDKYDTDSKKLERFCFHFRNYIKLLHFQRITDYVGKKIATYSYRD